MNWVQVDLRRVVTLFQSDSESSPSNCFLFFLKKKEKTNLIQANTGVVDSDNQNPANNIFWLKLIANMTHLPLFIILASTKAQICNEQQLVGQHCVDMVQLWCLLESQVHFGKK
jgi:hypothetical protein